MQDEFLILQILEKSIYFYTKNKRQKNSIFYQISLDKTAEML